MSILPQPSIFDGRVCVRCKIFKFFPEYRPRPASRDGYDYACRACLNKHRSDYYHAVQKADPAWVANVRRKNSQRYYDNHEVRCQKLRERYRTVIAPRREADPQPFREEAARNYRKHKAQKLDYGRKHREANPEMYRVYVENRRARREAAEGSYTQAEWRELCERFGNVCLCCGQAKPLSADHVIPISRGGSNYITNLQPLCISCNSSKGTKTTDYRPH